MPSQGVLLDNNDFTIDKIYDPESQTYFLVPELPLEAGSVDTVHTVALIDSGVLANHPQLRPFIVGERDYTGEGPEDKLGHGTIVALTLLGDMYPDRCGILSLKVASKGIAPTRDNVIAALRYADEYGAAFANVSLGFSGSKAENRELCRAIEQLKNTCIFAAAGNLGPLATYYPARCQSDRVMSVGALAEPSMFTTLLRKFGVVPRASYSGRAKVYASGKSARVVHPAVYYTNAGLSIVDDDQRQEEARDLFTKALKYGELPEATFGLALIDAHSAHYRAALRKLRRVIRLRPEFPQAYREIGVICARCGAFERALDYIELAIMMGDTSVIVHFDRGAVLQHLGRDEDALKEYVLVEQLDPQFPGIQDYIRGVSVTTQE